MLKHTARDGHSHSVIATHFAVALAHRPQKDPGESSRQQRLVLLENVLTIRKQQLQRQLARALGKQGLFVGQAGCPREQNRSKIFASKRLVHLLLSAAPHTDQPACQVFSQHCPSRKGGECQPAQITGASPSCRAWPWRRASFFPVSGQNCHSLPPGHDKDAQG